MMISVYWLIAGAALLALEAFGLPGIGFMLAGVAAIIVGALVEFSIIGAGATITQAGVFFLITSLLTIVLWKRLKAWRMNPATPEYSNIIGTQAVVVEAIAVGGTGTVRWSGTIMQARLAAGITTALAPGTTVTIRAVDGNILLVAPQ